MRAWLSVRQIKRSLGSEEAWEVQIARYVQAVTHAQMREPPRGFINPASVRETKEVTTVSLFCFLFSLSRGKQT